MPSRAVRSRKRADAVGYCGDHFTEEEWLELVEKCGGACLRCGATEDLSADHIVPLSLGGSNAITNIQPLCEACNNSKGLAVVDYRPRSPPMDSTLTGKVPRAEERVW